MSIKLITRRISNIFARGKLLKLTPGKVPTAKVGLFANEIYDGLEFPQTFGFICYPPVNSEILAAFLGGNRDHGTILGIINRDLVPDTLEEGEVMLYHAFDASIKLDKDSKIIIKNANATVTVNTDGTITIDSPTVTFTGDIVVDGTINGITIP